MLAEDVEVVGVQPSLVGALKPLAEFNIEDLKAQTAGSIAVVLRFGHSQPIAANLGVNARL
jgi:hypothetical protein